LTAALGSKIAALQPPTNISELRLPQVTEVMTHLNANCLKTTQPFSAFVEAAKKTGDEGNEKQLRIERASKQLEIQTDNFLGKATTSYCGAVSSQPSGKEVTAAVRGGLLSLEEACERYTLSVDEFLAWQHAVDTHGVGGLRVTRIQQYRF
jgi:hypothetical protein